MKISEINLICGFIMACLTAFDPPAQQPGFKISGQVTGLKDSTKIYLRNAKPEKIIDSAVVINGNFTLSGRINERARQAYIFTAKYENYVSLWLENKPMSIELKTGEFKKAVVKGSSMQDEEAEFRKQQSYFEVKRDSLNKTLSKTTVEQEKSMLKKQITDWHEKEQQFLINYITQNPDSFYSAYIVGVSAISWGKEKTQSAYNKLSAAMKQTPFGKEAKAYISLNKSILIGNKFEDFEQLNIKGKKIKLSDIKGEYILLDFWAAWCGPCREENPRLVELYKQYQPKGFNILGVSADDNKKAWLDAVKKDGLLWENVSDLRGDNNKAALIYGVNAYPSNYLIDKNGIIIAKNVRGKALEDKLKELLP
jgi:peroxiredoxin